MALRSPALACLAVAMLAVPLTLSAQTVTPSPSPAPPAARRTVVAGPAYKAGGLHRLLLGNHYRSVWTAPIDVPVLDLGTHAGGLTPKRKGGGKQTKSLSFAAGDGREFKFRSVDKDPTAT